MAKCSICDNEGKLSRGLCQTHYGRLWRGKPLDAPVRKKEKHGLKNTPEYVVWRGMRQRCEDHKAREYDRYGGRGIKVCQRWVESFAAFYEDMGPRPTDGGTRYTVERIDNDKGYSPDNCRWATYKEQGSNKRPMVRKKEGEMRTLHIYRTNRRVKESPYLTACKERDGVLGNIELNEYTNVDDMISDKEFRVDPGSNVKRKWIVLSKIYDQDGSTWQGIADELNKPGVFARLADILKRK